jgi:hypothetical protein
MMNRHRDTETQSVKEKQRKQETEGRNDDGIRSLPFFLLCFSVSLFLCFSVSLFLCGNLLRLW